MAALGSSIMLHAQSPVDVHTHIILPENVLQGNLNRLKKTLDTDRELSRHADLFLRENAARLFGFE